MYVCIYLSIYLFIYLCIYECTDVCTHVCIFLVPKCMQITGPISRMQQTARRTAPGWKKKQQIYHGKTKIKNMLKSWILSENDAADCDKVPPNLQDLLEINWKINGRVVRPQKARSNTLRVCAPTCMEIMHYLGSSGNLPACLLKYVSFDWVHSETRKC